MSTFIATLSVFLVVAFIMAVGVMLGGKRLKGSCGGIGGECPCDEPAQQACERKRAAEA